MPCQGEIHLLGAAEGNTLFILSHLAEILEPLNICRRIVVFDSFNTSSEIYSSVSHSDGNYYDDNPRPHCHDFSKLSHDVSPFNRNTRIYPEERIVLIPGDASVTYPKYINDNSPLIPASCILRFIKLRISLRTPQYAQIIHRCFFSWIQ